MEALETKYIEYVKGSINLMVAGAEDQFPVMSSTIVKCGVATRKQLDLLEEAGHIRSVTIEVPSVLVPTKTVPEKAYYTEARIPELVKGMQTTN